MIHFNQKLLRSICYQYIVEKERWTDTNSTLWLRSIVNISHGRALYWNVHNILARFILCEIDISREESVIK